MAAAAGRGLADAAARGARVVSSDLISRARQSAEPLAKALGVDLELDDALRELGRRRLAAGLQRDDIGQSRFPDEYGRWMAGGPASAARRWGTVAVRCERIRRHGSDDRRGGRPHPGSGLARWPRCVGRCCACWA
ncbi:MAG: histidine phosphatase family protein [Kineosporiaceae bacterium]